MMMQSQMWRPVVIVADKATAHSLTRIKRQVGFPTRYHITLPNGQQALLRPKPAHQQEWWLFTQEGPLVLLRQGEGNFFLLRGQHELAIFTPGSHLLQQVNDLHIRLNEPQVEQLAVAIGAIIQQFLRPASQVLWALSR